MSRPFQKSGTHQRWSRVVGVVLGLLLLAAAILKWRNPGYGESFYGTLTKGTPALAWGILMAEALVGLWLLSGFRLSVAGGSAVFLLALFTGAIMFDIFSPHPKPCGCFGAAWAAANNPVLIERGLALGVMRNIVLMALAAFLFLAPPTKAQKLSAAG